MRDILRRLAGAVAGLALFCAVVSVSLLNGYAGLEPCDPRNPAFSSCAPNLQQLIISSPQDALALRFAPWLLALALIIGLPVWVATPLRAERRGGSIRTVMLVVALLATGLLMVDCIILYSQMSQADTSRVCLSDASGAPIACFTGALARLVALAGLGAGPLAGALLAGLPAWVMTLVQAARWRRWGWFVVVLLLSPVASLLYASFGPSGPASAARITPTPAPAFSLRD